MPLPVVAPIRAQDGLDRGEQRVSEEQGPGQAKAELRADLAVSPYAAGIVVRRAGNQSRPEHLSG